MSIRTVLIHSLMSLSLLTMLVGAAQAADNTIFGTGAGASLTADAHENTLIGVNAGAAITTSDENTLVGYWAGRYTTGVHSTIMGESAGRDITTGFTNTFFGRQAGFHTTTGFANTYLGSAAGSNNETGSYNVFVGYQAGYNELGSARLYIANSGTAAPLIYGDFDNELVGINAALGVGTQIPLAKLHVHNGNLRLEQTGATHAILNFIANGQTWEIKNNQATGRLTFFAPGGGATTASFKFDRQAVENLLRVGVLAPDTVDITGDLVVTGSISPDYVFSPEYDLESIEAHAASMWAHRHLPAVGPGQVNAQGQAMVNVGKRSQGMLEELEKAHIYIDQLQGAMTALKATEAELEGLKGKMMGKVAQLDALQDEPVHKGDPMAALTREVAALQATEAELEALQGQMTAKAAELDTLQDEMAGKDAELAALRGDVTALKALIQQLMGINRGTAPGKEG